MDTLRHFHKTAVDFLALPLIALSAALCVIERVTTLKTVDFSVFFAALFAVLCYRRQWKWCAVAALSAYACFALSDVITEPLAAFCGRHPSLFGAVNGLYTLCFGNRLAQTVLHTDCTGAVVTARGIITGAADGYTFGTAGAAEAASRWLSGGYFAALFLPLGAAAFLWRGATKKEKGLLLSALALSVLAGDNRLVLLTLLLLYPVGLVLYLLMTGLSYFTAALLQSGIGYRVSPSAFELVKNGNGQTILLILTGCVLAATYYFAARYAENKWKMDN